MRRRGGKPDGRSDLKKDPAVYRSAKSKAADRKADAKADAKYFGGGDFDRLARGGHRS